MKVPSMLVCASWDEPSLIFTDLSKAFRNELKQAIQYPTESNSLSLKLLW